MLCISALAVSASSRGVGSHVENVHIRHPVMILDAMCHDLVIASPCLSDGHAHTMAELSLEWGVTETKWGSTHTLANHLQSTSWGGVWSCGAKFMAACA